MTRSNEPGEELTFADVWRAELEQVCPEALPPDSGPQTADSIAAAVDAGGTGLSALCLSGGGIRSATFGLGVMQALARFELLGKFHYLSTVSGGGYIGGWLSTWRSCAPDPEVFAALNELSQHGVDPPQIRGLREDSNYITPRLGLLSADTWAIFTLYFRNLILNWLLFAPFFVGCLLVPRWWEDTLQWMRQFGSRTHYALLAAGGLLLLAGLSFGVYGRYKRKDAWLSKRRFLMLVLAPLVASAMCFCLASQAFASGFWRHPYPVGAIAGLVIYSAAWIFGRVIVDPDRSDPHDTGEAVAWALSGALVGLIVAVGMVAAEHRSSSLTVSLLGIGWCVGAYLAGDILYVGAASFRTHGDMDREWLARASGWLAAVAVTWTLIAAVVLLLAPWAIQVIPAKISAVVAVGGASGLVTLLLGWSEKTGATVAAQALKKVSLSQIASAAAVVFAVVLTALLASAGRAIVTDASPLIPSPAWSRGFPLIDVCAIAALVFTACFLSYFINVNRFSLHALYRNRLARAYIGSARSGVADRTLDPFTRFAQSDNVSLEKVKPRTEKGPLFHLINATLNVVATKKLAWQERKAESFTFSRLHCGNPQVGYRKTELYATGRGRGGVTLATAMAISGAAVSPNEGYNSSPLVSFLLMLFNVRLGWWLGNPRKGTYHKEGPEYGIAPALKELAGATTDEGPWIYLSDGGHFENLGLYEVLRRRCRRIVVSDADCDPSFTFADLGNAARKVFIDMGVGIRFRHFELQARQSPPVPGVRFAIGTISYPDSDEPGWLLYIKPTYQGTEGVDVRSYASMHSGFPHESTADQWFSESQLESYRALGAFIMEDICTSGGRRLVRSMSLTELKTAAEERLRTAMVETVGSAEGDKVA
ncbi:MAG TPA: patatin-like phospholipase family protein [Steroidobacteraceae bacterium]|nr:patatin-like phospholipase family protein [Steroidobacteraceae bacterium]